MKLISSEVSFLFAIIRRFVVLISDTLPRQSEKDNGSSNIFIFIVSKTAIDSLDGAPIWMLSKIGETVDNSEQ